METQQPPAPDQQPSDGLGLLRGDAEAQTQSRIAEIDVRRKAILENARAKMKADFRTSQGVPAPEPRADPTPVAQIAPVSQSGQQTPSGLAEAFTNQLNSQFQAAQQMRTEAAAMKAEADSRATAAEQKLNAFLANPTTYMQETGLNVDQWTARLLNGGEATPEEKLRADMEAMIEARTEPERKELNQLKQELHEERRGKVINELSTAMEKEYPLINMLLGPERALDTLVEQSKAQGKALNPEQFFANLENNFINQYKATLQNNAIATKLGLSVPSSPAAVVVKSPPTLSNRVVSTVSSVPSRPTTDRDRIARDRAAGVGAI